MAPSPPAGPARRGPPLALSLAVLAAILAFGADSMFGQLRRSGYGAMLRPLVAGAGDGLLPGSDRPLLYRYTGFAPMDRLLVMANVVWANVADGSRPQMSLYMLQFAGQLVPLFVVLVVEGLRVGNRWNLLRVPAAWGLIGQAIGFGIMMPVYFILNLILRANTPILDTVLVRDHVQISTLFPALALVYYPLSALLAYPFQDPFIRQWANAFWQGFPLHAVLLQGVFAWVSKRISLGQDAATPRAQLDRRALKGAYRMALMAGTTIQWLVYYVTVTSAVYSHLFPGDMAQLFTPDKVFLPGSFHSSAPMESAAAAMHDFMIYDQVTTSAAALVWATTVAVRAGTVSLDVASVMGILKNCVLVGPGGAVVMLMMQRDEGVLASVPETVK